MVTAGDGKELEERKKKVLLTKPLSLEPNSDHSADSDNYKSPNLLQSILSLFKNVHPGSLLTNFQLPPLFNLPKTQLQLFGESVYCVGKELLHDCNNGDTPLERFISVVGWSISTARPLMFGVAPYNPILGETHHVSRGTLNLLLEQVSHHPPVSALHATDEKENIEMIWCHSPVPRFYGSKVEAEVVGRKQLKLLKHGETYVMNSPSLCIKFLPPSVDWVGNVTIKCQETGLEAQLSYKSVSFLGRVGSYHSIQGKIYQHSSSTTIYDLHGHWNSTVRVKDVKNGKETIIYDAREVLSGLKTPIVKDLQGVWETESGRIWSDVSEGILSKNWEKAREAKKSVEENQRLLVKERNSRGETWIPKHFVVSCSEEGGWDCSPIQPCVPSAPIEVPL